MVRPWSQLMMPSVPAALQRLGDTRKPRRGSGRRDGRHGLERPPVGDRPLPLCLRRLDRHLDRAFRCRGEIGRPDAALERRATPFWMRPFASTIAVVVPRRRLTSLVFIRDLAHDLRAHVLEAVRQLDLGRW